MSGQLYMVQLHPAPKELIRFLAHQRLNAKTDEDLGYGAHAWLQATFGTTAPKPFRLFFSSRHGEHAKLLGYTTANRQDLVNHASTFAEPTARAVCDLAQDLAVSAMPGAETWHPGRRLGFEVLLCPVAREARTGRERDYYLHAVDMAAEGVKLCRDDVYLRWLADHFGGAASLDHGNLEEFRLVEQLRRGPRKTDSSRQSARLVRPRVLVRGVLTIRDSAGFAALLARGVGRHRGFGYGMLLLSPGR